MQPRVVIEAVAFGNMTINAVRYNSDLIIYPDGSVQSGWRRTRGHRLALEDLQALLAVELEELVAGTGIMGLMRPHPKLKEDLLEMGIHLHAATNRKAAAIYHRLQAEGRRVGACFHLSC